MREAASDLAAGLERAATEVGEAVAGVSPGWLALGVILHLGNQVVRGRGWYAIVRAASTGTERPGPTTPASGIRSATASRSAAASGTPSQLRARDAIAAWVAGAGAGGVLSARGGDAVRVLLLSRRTRGTGCPVLAGTLVAEGVGEAALGIVLLLLAIAVGAGPALSAPGWDALPWMTGAAALLAGAGIVTWRWPPLRAIVTGVGRGCVALRAPREYARSVLPWQAASRLLRAVALACFLVAFGLPATPAAIILVMLAQAGGRLVPLAPVSAGASAAVLAASYGPLTGASVSAGQVAAFLVGTSAVLTAVGAVLAVAIALRATDLRGLAAWRRLGALQRTARGTARA